MRALTHYVFSAGSSLYLLSVAGEMSAGYLLLALWLSLAVNLIIDGLGHGIRRGRSRRSALTHSLITGPAWGALVGASSAALALGPSPVPSLFAAWAALGAFVSLIHLLLDALTEGGVYLVRRRIALAHLRYDNPLLNAAFVLLGVSLALASLA